MMSDDPPFTQDGAWRYPTVMRNVDHVGCCPGCGGVLEHAPRCLEVGCPWCGLPEAECEEDCPYEWYRTFDEHRDGKPPEEED